MALAVSELLTVEPTASSWFPRRTQNAKPSNGSPIMKASQQPIPAEPREPAKALQRSQYKDIWNSQSGTEDQAKIAVAGYADEGAFRRAAEQTRDLLRGCVGLSQDDVVLEIGAGVGRVGAILAPLCREWIGADVSENMVAHMDRRLGEFANVRTLVLNGYDLSSIPDKSVDLVYCTVVFMHLSEWDRYAYVREGFRVLRPGGRMLVDNVNLLCDEGWKFFLGHTKIPPHERPPHISMTSTPQELETYFRRAGFEKIRQKFNDLWVVTYGVKPSGKGRLRKIRKRIRKALARHFSNP